VGRKDYWSFKGERQKPVRQQKIAGNIGAIAEIDVELLGRKKEETQSKYLTVRGKEHKKTSTGLIGSYEGRAKQRGTKLVVLLRTAEASYENEWEDSRGGRFEAMGFRPPKKRFFFFFLKGIEESGAGRDDKDCGRESGCQKGAGKGRKEEGKKGFQRTGIFCD